MLQEVRQTRQVPGERLRRWFSDDYFDLIVWYEPDGSVHGFQLCYDKRGYERAVTWTRKDAAPTHSRIDGGEAIPGKPKMSPVLCSDGILDKDGIAARLERERGELDAATAALITRTLLAFPHVEGVKGTTI